MNVYIVFSNDTTHKFPSWDVVADYLEENPKFYLYLDSDIPQIKGIVEANSHEEARDMIFGIKVREE